MTRGSKPRASSRFHKRVRSAASARVPAGARSSVGENALRGKVWLIPSRRPPAPTECVAFVPNTPNPKCLFVGSFMEWAIDTGSMTIVFRAAPTSYSAAGERLSLFMAVSGIDTPSRHASWRGFRNPGKSSGNRSWRVIANGTSGSATPYKSRVGRKWLSGSVSAGKENAYRTG